MKNLVQLLIGVGAALLSIVLVFGSFSMAFTEDSQVWALVQTVTGTFTPVPSQPQPGTSIPLETRVPQAIASPTPVVALAPVQPLATLTVECPAPPAGWSRITVLSGDTLAGLAQAFGTSVEALRQVNCLDIDTLKPGGTVFVPGSPTQTPAVVCGPPPTWVFYLIQPGDTLSSLSRMFRVSVYDLQLANCMVGQDLIRWGAKLYVPNVPVLTRTPTSTLSPTSPPFIEPSSTNTAVPTRTNTPLPTLPVEPTLTPTQAPTLTPTSTPTPTPTPTETPTSTPTPTPTSTFTDTPSPTPTNTPIPTL